MTQEQAEEPDWLKEVEEIGYSDVLLDTHIYECKPTKPGEWWCRYEDGINLTIRLRWYKVIRHTPCGVKLDYWGEEKQAYNNTRRSFAYPDKKKAWDSYKARKRWQRTHLMTSLDACNSRLEIIKRIDEGEGT